MTAKLVFKHRGAIAIEGDFELFDAEGNRIEPKTERVLLCRCGASRNKPFCDGGHNRIGFDDTKDQAG